MKRLTNNDFLAFLQTATALFGARLSLNKEQAEAWREALRPYTLAECTEALNLAVARSIFLDLPPLLESLRERRRAGAMQGESRRAQAVAAERTQAQASAEEFARIRREVEAMGAGAEEWKARILAKEPDCGWMRRYSASSDMWILIIHDRAVRGVAKVPVGIRPQGGYTFAEVPVVEHWAQIAAERQAACTGAGGCDGGR